MATLPVLPVSDPQAALLTYMVDILRERRADCMLRATLMRNELRRRQRKPATPEAEEEISYLVFSARKANWALVRAIHLRYALWGAELEQIDDAHYAPDQKRKGAQPPVLSSGPRGHSVRPPPAEVVLRPDDEWRDDPVS